MRAAQVVEPGTIRVIDLPDPVPGPADVVLAVDTCGVCGTDLHVLAGDWPADFKPIVPGHEYAGVVTAIGGDVIGFEVGERVAVQPNIYCGACHYCRKARPNLCERWTATGGTEPGAFAELVMAPVANTYHVPAGMPMAWAAMAEPVSCAIHGLDRLEPRFGESFLIIGAGTMGMILGQLLRRAGASLVAFCDVVPIRLEQARAFGFEALAIDIDEARSFVTRGYDNVIDASGVTNVVEQALDAVATGGKLLVFGVTPRADRASYSPFRVYSEEVSIIGSMSVLHSFDRALAAIENGSVDVGSMISHSVPLEEIERAVELVRDHAGLKIQVQPNGPS